MSFPALAHALASRGKPAFLASRVPGVLVEAASPAAIYPEDGGILVTVSLRNPWKAPVGLRQLRLTHVTMGEMPAVAPPARLAALPGPAWLDAAGFVLQPGETRTGRLCFAARKLEVSMPCALEATPSIGRVGRGGVLCVPIKDLEAAARKALTPGSRPSA